MKTFLKWFAVITGSILVLGFIAILVTGSLGPDTSVYPGRQVPRKYLDEIRRLGLLEADENLQYFYSDAWYDIKDGFYFVSDKKLVIYSNAWDDPDEAIRFDQISDIFVDYQESFFIDSTVTVRTKDGMEISFPVSSEGRLDKRFVEYLLKHSEVEPTAPGGVTL